MSPTANAEAIEAWDTILFDKFVRFRDTIIGGLGAHGTAALERHPPSKGSRVLDVGCGFGDTTLAIAREVGREGEAVGVDAAPRFIANASQSATSAGVANARFFVADVESDDLKGPYDAAFSRFGTMFFSNPVGALRNVRRSLAKGAPLTMVVWRKKDENWWAAEIERRVLEIVPHPEKGDQVTCGPGPFSMASPDVVSAQLVAAGYSRITFERFDVEMRIGRDMDDAVAFALALGPAGEILRLAGDAAKDKMPAVVDAIRDTLGPHARKDGVYGASSSWIVTALANS